MDLHTRCKNNFLCTTYLTFVSAIIITDDSLASDYNQEIQQEQC